jgi:AIG2-like family
MPTVCQLTPLLFIVAWILQSSRALDTYPYFAIGSNLMPSTMTSLRNLSPRSTTAAVLLDYALVFNIPGSRWIEPSAAAVVRRPHARVHGVLYTLTEDDFGTLGQSEGVPFAYRWERCRVIPYRGDGRCAGDTALANALGAEDQNYDVPAFVLMASQGDPNNGKSIPPSKSYLQILQDGARYWQLDQSYQEQLAGTKVDLWVPGTSGCLLATAERWNPKPPLQ